MHSASQPTPVRTPSWRARAAIGCTVAAACLAAASTPASAGGPGLPSVPQVPNPPALPQLPSVQPPSVTLPAPPSVRQVPVPRTPSAPAVPAPSLPGSSGGAGTGGAAPAAPGTFSGQGTAGSLPNSAGGGSESASTPAGAKRPAQRRRESRRLQRSVRNLQGCLSSVGGLDRRVLVLRAGLGGRPASSRQSVARRLDVSQRRVARAERSGLKSLRGAARGGSCESGPSPMVVSRTPWLMPLGSVSTGTSLPLLSMASLAGDSRAEERSDGGVMGVSRSGPEDLLADGSESPGSLVSGDEAEREPERVAASTGDSADLLLPLLLTIALLALLAGFVMFRGRRTSSDGPSIIENPTPLRETRAAQAPVEPAVGAVARQPDPGPAPEPAREPDPEPAPQPAPLAAISQPLVEDEAQPATAPASSRRARNMRLAGSAAALAAGGVIRALLRVRRRR